MAKKLTGFVSSKSGEKTIVITVHTRKTHPIYKKQYRVSSKFMAHDEKNEANVGDRVTIGEVKPISKRKRFALESVISRAELSQKDIQAIEDNPTVEEDK